MGIKYICHVQTHTQAHVYGCFHMPVVHNNVCMFTLTGLWVVATDTRAHIHATDIRALKLIAHLLMGLTVNETKQGIAKMEVKKNRKAWISEILLCFCTY